jgi:hypothetical protein
MKRKESEMRRGETEHPLAYKGLAEQMGVKAELLQVSVGSIDVTTTERPLDYYLVSNDPWFVRSPVEISVIAADQHTEEVPSL